MEQPDFPPHTCSKCRSGNREFYLDIGVDTEFEGAVFLCNMCMSDLGIQSKMFVTIGDHQEALSEQEGLVEKYMEFLDKMRTWNSTFVYLTGQNLTDFCETISKVKEYEQRNSYSLTSTGTGTSDSPVFSDEPIIVPTEPEPEPIDNDSQPEQSDFKPLEIVFG